MKTHTRSMGRFLGRLLLLVGLLLAMGLLTSALATPAHAATTLTVTNCSSDSQLQADVAQANSDNAGDTITFGCSGDIPLTSTLNITGSMTMDGSGQSVTIDGQNNVDVLIVNSGVSFTLNTLTIAHGSAGPASPTAGDGGALFNEGSLTVTNSTLTGNSADDGGGIFNEGSLTVTNSTLTGNSAADNGGIANTFGATVTITNSTLTGNSADDGGGVGNFGTVTISNSTLTGNSGDGVDNFGTVTISNSTLTGNSKSIFGSGGIDNEIGGMINIGGSIVAANQGGDCKQYGTLNDQGYNLESATSCGFTSTGDLQNTDPKLDPNGLQNNGGPTQTIALLSTSPAIDQIPTASCPATDQRGDARPDNAETTCDMGAYEFRDPSLTLTGTNVNATEGAAFSGVVASGTYSGSGTLSATINWGDGSATSSGSISGTSSFTVSGSHTYAEEGTFTISVSVKDSGSLSASGTSSAKVADAALKLTSFVASPLGHLSAGLAATFTDADPAGTVSDYTATITWGDGSTSTVKAIKNPLGKGFALAGLHSYAKKGTYSITLTVVDQGGSQVSKTVSVTVK